jgi:hypothetical protein
MTSGACNIPVVAALYPLLFVRSCHHIDYMPATYAENDLHFANYDALRLDEVLFPQVSVTITACICNRDVATVRTFKNVTLPKDERICDFVATGLKMSTQALLLRCSFYVNGHRVLQPRRLRGIDIDGCRVVIAMAWH